MECPKSQLPDLPTDGMATYLDKGYTFGDQCIGKWNPQFSQVDSCPQIEIQHTHSNLKSDLYGLKILGAEESGTERRTLGIRFRFNYEVTSIKV